MTERKLPPLFQNLMNLGCLRQEEILHTSDGFFLAYRSLSQILLSKGIAEFPNRDGQLRRCDRFFDDWFVCALHWNSSWVCCLVKMREQEQDAETDIPADGDTPGITVSFIAYDGDSLLRCLENPHYDNRRAMSEEIDRVVAARGQRHHEALYQYFRRPEAEAPYLIARCYVHHVARFADNGCLAVPKRYAAIRRAKPASRLPRFLEANNAAAGYTVCDHERIFLRDPKQLSLPEALTILATHTANTSLHSFAAEVRFHALFLAPAARLPVLRRFLYRSAIRADMLIADKAQPDFLPYYRPNSRLLRQQERHHTPW